MRLGNPAGRFEQMLDSLSRGDPAHVQDDRRLRGNAQVPAQVAVTFSRHLAGIGETVASDVHLRRPDAARDHGVAFPVRRHDDRSRTARDPAVQSRVQQSLQQHLPQSRLEHAERLEDVRHVRNAAPGSDSRRDRVAEAEHVRNIRPVQPRECERKSGRDPHPSVAQRRREIAHAGAVDHTERRPERRAGVEIGDRRRDHVDVVPARDEPPHELARRHDRPAERPRRRPHGRGEKNAKRPRVHRCEVSAPAGSCVSRHRVATPRRRCLTPASGQRRRSIEAGGAGRSGADSPAETSFVTES